MWNFFIPMIICVLAYWKILVAIRRHASVMPTSRRNIIVVRPAAGPITETTLANNASASDNIGGTARTAANQNNPNGFSKAKINVIRTMILIIVCFVVCLMPYDVYWLIRDLTVFLYLFV